MRMEDLAVPPEVRRSRLVNNSNLCAQLFSTVLTENDKARMSVLASQLLVDLFDVYRGLPARRDNFNQLSKLVWADSASDLEHASHVLAHKNLVIFAESILGRAQREDETVEADASSAHEEESLKKGQSHNPRRGRKDDITGRKKRRSTSQESRVCTATNETQKMPRLSPHWTSESDGDSHSSSRKDESPPVLSTVEDTDEEDESEEEEEEETDGDESEPDYEDGEGLEGKDWIIACVCGQKRNDGRKLISCDGCKSPVVWQHWTCVKGWARKKENGDGFEYYCPSCREQRQSGARSVHSTADKPPPLLVKKNESSVVKETKEIKSEEEMISAIQNPSKFF